MMLMMISIGRRVKVIIKIISNEWNSRKKRVASPGTGLMSLNNTFGMPIRIAISPHADVHEV